MKIVADRQIAHAKEAFASIGDVVAIDGRDINPEILHDADILLVRSITRVDRNLLKNSSIKFIATATSGIDHIDARYLHEEKIGFAYAPGCNARSVAEYVLSSLFVLAEQNQFKLTDKTVGIIGYGEVGSRVKKFLDILGVSNIVNDPPLKDKSGDSFYSEINDVLTADIITLHVPLEDEGPYPTRNLVNESFFRNIKNDCILINTSRGDVIDLSAFRKHLDSNPDSQFVLDVWSDEPSIDVDLLSRVTIGTPHIAGYSTESKLRATEMIAQATCEYFNRQPDWEIPESRLFNQVHEIHISENLDLDEGTQLAVLSHYDPRSDAASLRRLPEISIQERAGYFDSLRKNYPVRREFPATLIHLDKSMNGMFSTFQQLGFRVGSI